jgi:serine/threonine protein kinase
MQYLEQEVVIHRDLAARNCLISMDSTIKIADFGLSVTEADLEAEKIDAGFRAPIRLMSPETISKTPVYSHKSDVWAYGMLLCKYLMQSYSSFSRGNLFGRSEAMGRRGGEDDCA